MEKEQIIRKAVRQLLFCFEKALDENHLELLTTRRSYLRKRTRSNSTGRIFQVERAASSAMLEGIEQSSEGLANVADTNEKLWGKQSGNKPFLFWKSVLRRWGNYCCFNQLRMTDAMYTVSQYGYSSYFNIMNFATAKEKWAEKRCRDLLEGKWRMCQELLMLKGYGMTYLWAQSYFALDLAPLILWGFLELC